MIGINKGVDSKRIQKLSGKLQYAYIGILAGRYLFGPINFSMGMEPQKKYGINDPSHTQHSMTEKNC